MQLDDITNREALQGLVLASLNKDTTSAEALAAVSLVAAGYGTGLPLPEQLHLEAGNTLFVEWLYGDLRGVTVAEPDGPPRVFLQGSPQD